PHAYGAVELIGRGSGCGARPVIDRMIRNACTQLWKMGIVFYDKAKETLSPTEMGRISSQYYLSPETVNLFVEELTAGVVDGRGIDPTEPVVTYAQILKLVCSSTEFQQLNARKDELFELECMMIGKQLAHANRQVDMIDSVSIAKGSGNVSQNKKLQSDIKKLSKRGGIQGVFRKGKDSKQASVIEISPVYGGSESTHGKVNILLQNYIARKSCRKSSLITDSNYIAQNAPRILRALLEICLANHWPNISIMCHSLCVSVECQRWWFDTPLWPLLKHCGLKAESLINISKKTFSFPSYGDIEEIEHESIGDIAILFSISRDQASAVKKVCKRVPRVDINTHVHPITDTVLNMSVLVRFRDVFECVKDLHGRSMGFWVLVESPEANLILFSRRIDLKTSGKLRRDGTMLSIPICTRSLSARLSGRNPSIFFVHVLSDDWPGSVGCVAEVDLSHCLPQDATREIPTLTRFLTLHPLSVRATNNARIEKYFPFRFFNPIQTHYFHRVFYSDENTIIGAPTGSGKTTAAELAIFRTHTDPNLFRAGVVEGVKIWMEEQAVGKMIDKKLIKSEKKKEEGEKDSLDLTQLSSSVLPIFCSDSGVVVYV
ncbi:Activating signal cointegrator 1 complex subunit 3, partial [Aduncisulcus paluster]